MSLTFRIGLPKNAFSNPDSEQNFRIQVKRYPGHCDWNNVLLLAYKVHLYRRGHLHLTNEIKRQGIILEFISHKIYGVV